MLDSGCMMLDDQGMTEEWIVRVQGKEYGPADIDTLREWKREGRLLPENEARPANADPTAVAGSAKEVSWSTAAGIPGLFDVAAGIPRAGRLRQDPPKLHRPRVLSIFEFLIGKGHGSTPLPATPRFA